MYIPTSRITRGRFTGLTLLCTLLACGTDSPVAVEPEPEPEAPADPAVIALSTSDVAFDLVEGGSAPSPSEIVITNVGAGALSALRVRAEYEGPAADWLELDLSGTSAPSRVRVRPMVDRLAEGEHRARIFVEADGVPNSPREVTVIARVGRPPAPGAVALSADHIELEMQEGGPNPDTVRVDVRNDGEVPLGALLVDVVHDRSDEPQWTEWLVSGLSSAEAPSVLSLVVLGAELEVGTWGADVVVSEEGGSADTLRVDLTVRPAPAVLRLERTTHSYSTARGAPNPPVEEIDILNDEPGSLVGLTAAARYPASGPEGWLSPNVYDNERGRWLSLGLHTSGLPEGTWSGVVEVDADNAVNGPVTLEVTVEVGPPSGFLNVNTGNVFVEVEHGTGSPSPLEFLVRNLSVGTLENLEVSVVPRAGSEGDWVAATLASSTAPTELTISFDVDGLTARGYYADLILSADGASNSPVSLRITLSVTGGVADLSVLGEPRDTAVVAAGESVELPVLTFTNIGTARSNSVLVGFYLSTDSELGAGDVSFGAAGYSPIDPGEEIVQPYGASIEIPADTPPGLYWLGVKIDDEDATPESDETNNAYTRLVRVTG